MRLVTRAEWQALSPSEDWCPVAGADGVKIHYAGSSVPADLADPGAHQRCADLVRDIQARHMANTEQGWIDVAYSALVCPHGFVFEGRGLHRENGANGNRSLNRAHYAVCALAGAGGLTTTAAAARASAGASDTLPCGPCPCGQPFVS